MTSDKKKRGKQHDVRGSSLMRLSKAIQSRTGEVSIGYNVLEIVAEELAKEARRVRGMR